MRPSWSRAIVALALVLLVSVACRTKRPPLVYRLDSETRGWVAIVFNRPEAPPLPEQGGAFFIDVPKSGVVSTSAKSPVGYARDAFLVRYPDGREVPLSMDAIRANHVGHSTWEDGKTIEYEVFFVGTRAELDAAETQDDMLTRVRASLPLR